MSPERAAAYTPIRYGDILFAASGETIEEIGKSAVNLMTVPAVCGGDVLRFRPAIPVDARFMGYACDCPSSVAQKSLMGRGFTVMHIYGSQLKSLSLALPPLREQAAIARFLDHADRRIRRYISAKQKLIKLLEELKAAIIHRAVTRGLDPNVRLKPSGVAWLGNVPEHWEVAALRRRWSVTDCKHLTVPFIDNEEGIPLASVREVQSFELSLANAKRTGRQYYESLIDGGRKPRKGDLIYCRNVSVGAAAIVTAEEPLAMGQDVCLIRSREQNQRYLNYFLRSPAMRHQLAILQVGSTFNRINVADIKALTIMVPPRKEQDAITSSLDIELKEIVRGQAAATEEISLLREYRTRLIADLVTGKLDVREAALLLPDESEEPSPLDQAETDPEEAATDDLDAIPEEAEA